MAIQAEGERERREGPRLELSRGEIEAARAWWRKLPDRQKAHWSIWNLLALYARHVLDTQTVCFDAAPEEDAED